ncbi:unnamed protein product [Clavelina lepadiformis]|uniref:Uncharacterized protein n=1 Tax=Clavelina lepadiformis TaxID=159417 RepID=A0ABP0FQP9_CLALP
MRAFSNTEKGPAYQGFISRKDRVTRQPENDAWLRRWRRNMWTQQRDMLAAIYKCGKGAFFRRVYCTADLCSGFGAGYEEKYTTPTVKHPLPSQMIWGAMSYMGLAGS